MREDLVSTLLGPGVSETLLVEGCRHREMGKESSHFADLVYKDLENMNWRNEPGENS